MSQAERPLSEDRIASVDEEILGLNRPIDLGVLADVRVFLQALIAELKSLEAFSLEVGGAAVLTGFLGVLLLGLFGTLPAGARVLRLPVADALKED